MKNNYPIFYALMPISSSSDYSILCYIVSKCYIVSERTIFNSDGTSKKEYEVVFPYQKDVNFYIWKKVDPEYNLISSYCSNSEIVEKVFYTKQEAKEEAIKQNEKLKVDSWINISFLKEYEKEINRRKDEFDKRILMYETLEDSIELLTDKLENDSIKVLDDLLTVEDKKIKSIFVNLYVYLRYPIHDDFMMYSISKEQYDKLLDIDDGEFNGDIKDIIGEIKPILFKGREDKFPILYDDANNKKYIIKYGRLEDFEKYEEITISPNTKCIFTTETIEDILLSYKNDTEIVPSDDHDGFNVRILKPVSND